MSNYVVLLPPSEGKRKGGSEDKIYSNVRGHGEHNNFSGLENDRKLVYGKLLEMFNEVSFEELEKLFGVKGKNLEKVVDLTMNMLDSYTMYAIHRYDGVMFKAINHESMDAEMKDRFNKNVVFISGMLGLLSPLDMIPDYKLKIDSKILDLDLSSFWKLKLKSYFDNLFEGKIIIDILPQAHRKVVNFESANEHYSIAFMDEKNSKLKQAGHNSKILKGELVRYICEKNEISRKSLEEFEHSSGYVYDEDLSNDNLIVYLKKF